MSGKKTYLRPGGHQQLEAGWVRPPKRAPNWQAIESAVQRPLSESERSMIAHAIELHGEFMRGNLA
jgi:hypothetical protein